MQHFIVNNAADIPFKQGKFINTNSCQNMQQFLTFYNELSSIKMWNCMSWISLWEAKRIKSDHWYPKWVELQWLATCICQQEPERLFCMCFYYNWALHRGTNATDRKGAKKLIHHWPVTYGTKGLPYVHREEVQTLFMIALSCVAPHHLSTQRWTLGTPILAQTDQASLIHLPPRCLCQVIAGGKRKTDQYISHETDR